MDQSITAVVSAPLTEDLGVTFVRGGAGWQFHDWHRSEVGAPSLAPPDPIDRERCFPTSAEALAYFRLLFVSRATSSQPFTRARITLQGR